MNGHLVTVEVRVVSGTNEWVNADRRAFDEFRFESLDRKAVKRWSTVQKDRMSFGHFCKDVPDFRRLAIDHFLRRTNGMAVAKFFQAANDEWFEQGKSHFLWKTALTEFEIGTDNDDRTSGVVDAFAEKVLTETAAFTFEHVAKGFEWAVASTGDGTAVSTVVEECIDSLLKHALLVPDNDFRSFEKKQVFETVVTVDDAAIEIVKIGCRETSTFERHKRTKIWRNDWKHQLNHPLGTSLGSSEALSNFKTLR